MFRRGLVVMSCVLRLGRGFWGSKPAVPPKGMACDEGWTVVREAWINDDFCDCKDGSDEAATAACAGVGGSSFLCENVGHEARRIPTSRVRDGVCDCCDGSDEEGCANECDAEAKKARERKEREARERKAGLEKRAAYVARFAAEIQDRAARRETAQREKTEAEAEIRALEPIVEHHDREEAERRDEATAAATAFYEDGLAEAFSAAQPHEIRAAAVRLAAAASDIETLLDVVTRSAGLDDKITDAIDDVEVLSLGVDAADALNEGNVEKFDELCAAIAAALSLDAVPADAAKRVATETARRASAIRHEIGGLAKRLVDLNPPDPDDDDEFATEEATKARDDLKNAEAKLETSRRALEALEDEDQDFGPDNAFGVLKDKCFKTRAAKYDYELCLFDKASQDHTSIGRFEKWADDYATMHYNHGTYCGGIGSRELTVHLQCGDDDLLLDVSEAQTCKYVATFKTPAACRP
ncbi:hypothetical protein CTAYLR_001102 [Chrysophaeum taylorii]|uniref:Glucosidase 2 subunit beta n=1 Tax=Chrysophaeum taylorii TaxID=2483200 RepID=A0AAD7XS40_9STRA|nr:hypothetical protein CTAYLR_001102 [Chrysophaeum taylorii]